MFKIDDYKDVGELCYFLPKLRYVATDLDGRVYGFEKKPRICENEWVAEEVGSIELLHVMDGCVPDWEHSLENILVMVEYKGITLEVPKEVKYIATDSCGSIYGYIDLPDKEGRQWDTPELKYHYLGENGAIEDWEKSLEEIF